MISSTTMDKSAAPPTLQASLPLSKAAENYLREMSKTVTNLVRDLSDVRIIKRQVTEFFDCLFMFLFPIGTERCALSSDARYECGKEIAESFYALLLLLGWDDSRSAHTVEKFLEQLPLIQGLLELDARAQEQIDPAAKSIGEIILCYPGFKATAYYRIAHALLLLEVPLLPRIGTEHAHFLTGIDIHPGATIGASFAIDHGSGVVIGETALLGEHVTLYQGVTLGALSVNKDDSSAKRHPTVEDHVTVYANATILGGKTVIGHHSIIGGNAWVTRSVPEFSRVYRSHFSKEES